MTAILVTGGTGFIGRFLVERLLSEGNSVTVVSRSPRTRFGSEVKVVSWDDDAGLTAAVGHSDAVVHLAGKQVVGQRWSESVKDEMVHSRVDTTARLVALMAKSGRTKTFICASAVGFYGAGRPTQVFTESSPAGAGFLAQLTQDWEAMARRAAEHGIRVITPRLGIVFGRGGGALAEMVKPFKVFLGGPIGSGEQVVSWVHIDDVVNLFLEFMNDVSISGPVNVTAPNPVTNAELATAIGQLLGRPAGLRVPAMALRLRFGEGAEPLLTGQCALPKVMQDRGYTWQYADVGSALRASL